MLVVLISRGISIVCPRVQGPRLTGSDEHEVGDGCPLEGVGGPHQGDVPAGRQAALVRQGEQQAVGVSLHQVDILDVT